MLVTNSKSRLHFRLAPSSQTNQESNHMQTLQKLGFKPKQKTPVQRFFESRRDRLPVRPDVDYHPEAEREPQAPKFTEMWLNHWDNWGNTKNPIATPLESGS